MIRCEVCAAPDALPEPDGAVLCANCARLAFFARVLMLSILEAATTEERIPTNG